VVVCRFSVGLCSGVLFLAWLWWWRAVSWLALVVACCFLAGFGGGVLFLGWLWWWRAMPC
jgi:hypothetical protein